MFYEKEGRPLYYIPVSGEEVQCTTAMAVPSREFLNWSSDGRLVYLTVDGDLVITDLLQGSEELLVALKDRLPINPTWSPESGRIAISVMDQAAENAEDEWASSEGIIPRRIGVVDLASQKLNRLTKGVGFGDELPQWSSDGKYILFARQNEEKVSLWFMRSNGAPVRERGNLGNTSQRKDITIPKKHSTTKGAKFFLRVLCG
jgi:dipeptidyl aminopeptidase/acylaminoacyl peptidase